MGDAAEIEGEADDHGHSARSRESGDMTGGAAARQGDSSPAAPIRGEKTRRRQVFAHEDRARGKAAVRRRAGKGPEHPIAHVAQVARTRPEMLVLGRLVLEYLIVQRRSPRAIGGRSDFDRAEGGLRQRLILEHGNLKGENVGAVAFGSGGEVQELAERGSDRLAQRLRLGRRFAGAARSASGIQQYGERTGCKAAGGYPSAKAKFSHARSRAGLPVIQFVLMEVQRHESAQRGQRRVRVGAGGAKVQNRALGRLHGHDLDYALGVDPGAVLRRREFDL